MDEHPSKNQRVLKTQALKESSIGNLIGKATPALENINSGKIATAEATTNKLSAFGQFLDVKMESIKDQEILDEFKEEVIFALFKAKRSRRNLDKIN